MAGQQVQRTILPAAWTLSQDPIVRLRAVAASIGAVQQVLDLQHRFDGDAAFGIPYRVVDLVKRVDAFELIERKLACLP